MATYSHKLRSQAIRTIVITQFSVKKDNDMKMSCRVAKNLQKNKFQTMKKPLKYLNK